MINKILKILNKDIWFHIFSFTSVFLIVVSFFIPPQGVIDSSVFAGVGELFAFAALGQVSRAIDKGYKTTIQHNNTSISVNDMIPEEINDENFEQTDQ